jgi:hypothetical protein
MVWAIAGVASRQLIMVAMRRFGIGAPGLLVITGGKDRSKIMLIPASLRASNNNNKASRMNFDVAFLFFSATITLLAAVGIILWILRREYLPVIKRLEKERDSAS